MDDRQILLNAEFAVENATLDELGRLNSLLDNEDMPGVRAWTRGVNARVLTEVRNDDRGIGKGSNYSPPPDNNSSGADEEDNDNSATREARRLAKERIYRMLGRTPPPHAQ